MGLRSAMAVAGMIPMIGAGVTMPQTLNNASPAAVSASLRTVLHRYLSSRRVPEHISAVSLAVTFRADKPGINLAVGRTRYAGGRPISPYELWQIGSSTKAFTSVLVLKLEADHKLSINDTLGKWLPQYKAWRRITIKRLLNMTSGIQEYEDQPAWQRAYIANPGRAFSAPRLASYAVGLTLLKGYSYSNTNYLLAQMIIARATHDSYGDQLRRRIFGPLGLSNAFYSPTTFPPAVTSRLPAGYFFNASQPLFAPLLGRDQSRRPLTYGQAAGGIISSLQDLAKWARAVYTGRELPTKQQRELESLVSQKTGKPIARTTASDPQGFGLGVTQATTAAFGGTVWTYTGEMFGFRVFHLYVPRSGTVITLGLNSSVEDVKPSYRLGISIYQTLHKAGLS